MITRCWSPQPPPRPRCARTEGGLKHERKPGKTPENPHVVRGFALKLWTHGGFAGILSQTGRNDPD
jgi:hypothetical protein